MPKTIAKLKHYLDMVPELSSRTLLSYSHLTRGVTNESYHIKFSKNDYVIKFFNPQAVNLGIDHKTELLILSRIEPLQLAPTVIYIDLDEAFSIARWIEGEDWPLADFDEDDKLALCINKVKALHEIPTEDLPQQDLLAVINNYRMQLADRKEFSSLLSDTLLQKVASIINNSALPNCLCHNDLLASNILLGPDHLYFLDWEFSGVNSPLFELAVFCRGNQLTEDRQNKVLECYFGQDWSRYKPLLSDWIWLYDYIELLWIFAISDPESEINADQLALITQFLNTPLSQGS